MALIVPQPALRYHRACESVSALIGCLACLLAFKNGIQLPVDYVQVLAYLSQGGKQDKPKKRKPAGRQGCAEEAKDDRYDSVESDCDQKAHCASGHGMCLLDRCDLIANRKSPDASRGLEFSGDTRTLT
jgi:hypothetical protein